MRTARVPTILAGCERRGTGISVRTAGSRAPRASARGALRFRACAQICRVPLALASRGSLVRALLVIAVLARVASADANDHVRIAIWLAQRGECKSALQYAQFVARDAPKTYARTLVNQPDLVACMMRDRPLGSPSLVESTAPKCESGVYAESSFFGGPQTALIHRIAFGGIARQCTPDATDLTDARIGLTLAITDSRYLQDTLAIGFEAELDHPVAHNLRFGIRVGAETNSEQLFTFGARVRYANSVYVGLDGFAATNSNMDAIRSGVLLGVGFQGKPGAYVAGGEGVLVGVLFILFIVSCSSGGC